MPASKIKISHGGLDYYKLAINSKVTMEEVKSKLLYLKQMSPQTVDLVLSFKNFPATIINGQELEVFLTDFNNTINELAFNLVAIENTDNLPKASNILDIPILKLDKLKSSRFSDINISTKDSLGSIENSLIIEEPVRSGIKLEHKGDIIVTSFVSNGAEVVAGGNIHVYGGCRGRLIAGAQGNSEARIFAAKFNPELVAINGIYRVLDGDLPKNLLEQLVMVSLDKKNRLSLIPLNK